MTLVTGTWPGFVARVATPSIPADTAALIVEAWPAVVGTEVTFGELLAMLAQIMLETGEREGPDVEHQPAGYWNGNPGNIRGAFQSWWTSFRAGEGSGADEVILEPGPENRFRSYIGPEEDPNDPAVIRRAQERGVRDMIEMIARKYPRALERARANDFAGYVHELHAGGYFTAAETAYENAEDRLRHTVEQLPQVAAFLDEPIRQALAA